MSEILGQGHDFGLGTKTKTGEVSTSDKADQSTELEKRTYIKQDLGRWFAIYQLANKKHSLESMDRKTIFHHKQQKNSIGETYDQTP